MKRPLVSLFALASGGVFALIAFACSSSTEPSPADGGIADSGVVETSPESGPCVQDKKRVPKDDSGVCWPGLFKACVNVSSGDVSPCICSTVECGTAAMQPPPNVPCCTNPPVSSDCKTPLGNGGPNMAGDTQCKCGP